MEKFKLRKNFIQSHIDRTNDDIEELTRKQNKNKKLIMAGNSIFITSSIIFLSTVGMYFFEIPMNFNINTIAVALPILTITSLGGAILGIISSDNKIKTAIELESTQELLDFYEKKLNDLEISDTPEIKQTIEQEEPDADLIAAIKQAIDEHYMQVENEENKDLNLTLK